LNSSKPLFILAGNGPYDNRGCEAIVRGTTRIIRQYYRDPEFLAVSYFQNAQQFELQASRECDDSITHRQVYRYGPRYSPSWFFYNSLRFACPALWRKRIYRAMLKDLKVSKAVLSVGGDNYSLDYGAPYYFTTLDDLVLSYKKPIIIWGASVGPFDRMPDYERFMIKHLKKVTGIFVRETVSLEYLASKGVTNNVVLVADPAFLLEPVKPAAPPKIERGAIGINLSPLMAKYWTEGSYQDLVNLASLIVKTISKETLRKIYLIPHVLKSRNNDHAFLEDVLSLSKGVDVSLIGPQYDAAETKWIISQMEVFGGARTHSTIASLSTGVPTLSFVYSAKARGINRDIFGHEKYCVFKHEKDPEIITDRIKMILVEKDNIRNELCGLLPEIKSKALLGGQKLAEFSR
jgi:colanic acid/amylovoran biosynthesis protein